MDKGKTFLDKLQEVIKNLQEDGIITQEQLEEKIEIPIEWLYSKGIDRNVMTKTMDNICAMINPAYKKNPKKTYAINSIRICEKNGKIMIEVPGRDNWTCFYLSDDNYHKRGKTSYFSSEEFIHEIYKTMLEEKQNKLKQNIDSLSTEEVMNLLSIVYDRTQKENELKGLSISLSEMIENFGQYYRYLNNEPNEIKKELQSEVKAINGGLIEQETDTRISSESSNSSGERKNEIYPFEERDMIFRKLKPLQVISFDSIGEDGKVINGTYTSYVYKNQRENGGYFIITEPYQGDKESRGTYLTDKDLQEMQEGEGNSNVFVDIARYYLEMSKQEFSKEKGTYTFKHRDLKNYAARMKYIISGEIDPNVSKNIIHSAKLNLNQLFGTNIDKKKLSKIADSVTEQEIDEARSIITPKTVEQDVGGRE